VKSSITGRAVALLANREHSALELSRKLEKAGFDAEDVAQTLAQLQQSGLQSDARFTDSYIRSRSNRGYGSIRIQMELKERGVSQELITLSLQHAEIDWFALAVHVRCKRFGEQRPDELKSLAKQQRFLQYRGFTHEQITESFNITDDEK
jgi:regulatory protein